MPIRLLVSDVDGTLVRNDKTLSAAVLEAVSHLRDAAIRLAIVSSRAPVGLDVLVAPLQLDTPRAGFNGAVILGPDDRALRNIFVPDAVCRKTVDHLESAGLDVWLFADGRWKLRNADQPYIAHERRSLGIGFEIVDDFSPFYGRTHKIMGVSEDLDAVADAEAILAPAIGDEASVHRSQLFHVDVTSIRANKGDAALLIAQSLGIDRADMACIGDMSNDIPMLDAAGLAIAMGNAPDIVRAHAHEVVASNEEDGWAEAVERLILPSATDGR